MDNTEAIRAAINEATLRAVDYWGTEHDEEVVILAGLACGGLTVPAAEFHVMVEALIAIAHADTTRDLSPYGGPWNADLDQIVAFEQDQRAEYDAALNRVVAGQQTAEIVPFPVRALQVA